MKRKSTRKFQGNLGVGIFIRAFLATIKQRKTTCWRGENDQIYRIFFLCIGKKQQLCNTNFTVTFWYCYCSVVVVRFLWLFSLFFGQPNCSSFYSPCSICSASWCAQFIHFPLEQSEYYFQFPCWCFSLKHLQPKCRIFVCINTSFRRLYWLFSSHTRSKKKKEYSVALKMDIYRDRDLEKDFQSIFSWLNMYSMNFVNMR